jgi:polyhydroxyalkanoate synthase
VTTARAPDVNRLLDVAQDQVLKSRQRIQKGLDILLAREEPLVGVTPKDVIYSRGTLRLYHYRPMTDEVYRVPVVFVMSLVSKPFILDLTFGQSFVQYMLAQGFDVFMIDWGIPRPEDKRLKLDDYVLDFMPRCFAEVQKATGEDEYSILGYCMGGQLALMYGGVFPDAPVKNMITAASPVDMEGMGLFRHFSDPLDELCPSARQPVGPSVRLRLPHHVQVDKRANPVSRRSLSADDPRAHVGKQADEEHVHPRWQAR